MSDDDIATFDSVDLDTQKDGCPDCGAKLHEHDKRRDYDKGPKGAYGYSYECP